MYHAELIYGIRTAWADEMVLKEYGLEFVHNQLITVPERLLIHLPRKEKSQTVSLDDWQNPDWDDRLHKYAADAGMIDYDIGWHVYIPTMATFDTPSITSFDFDKASKALMGRKVCGCAGPCSCFQSVGTDTGRFSAAKSNISNPPKAGKKVYSKPNITTVNIASNLSVAEQEKLLDELFEAQKDSIGGKLVVREGVNLTYEQLTLGKEEILHTTVFGDLVNNPSDRTWTVKYWRRGGSKLAAPLKFKVEVHPSDNTIVARWREFPFPLASLQQFNHYPTPSLVEEITKVVNGLFADYRELRRRGEPQREYDKILCEIIVDDPVGDGETKTYKFDSGEVQQHGDRWFILSWKQDGLELIKPLEIQAGNKGQLSFISKCGEFAAASSYKSPQDVVADLADVLFRRYAKLLDQRGDDSENCAQHRKFLSSKIRSLPVGKPIIKDSFSKDEVEPTTWVFSDKEGSGGIKGRGDHWSVMGWKTDNFELIKPIEVQLHASIIGLTAEYKDFSGPTRTCPKAAVRDFVKWVFQYYEELGKLPVNEMSSQDVADFDFFDKIIQQRSVEEMSLKAMSDEIAEAIDIACVFRLKEPMIEAKTVKWPKSYASIGRCSNDEDLVAQAKAYLEKKLDE